MKCVVCEASRFADSSLCPTCKTAATKARVSMKSADAVTATEWAARRVRKQYRELVGGLRTDRDRWEQMCLDYIRHLRAAEVENDLLKKRDIEANGALVKLEKEVERLRKALHLISLDEYESTSSSSEKVHGHARIARQALSGEK